MLAIVTNFGRSRVFPSGQGNLWFGNLKPVEVKDPKLIKQLQDYNKRRDILLEIKIVEKDIELDYSAFKVQQLRSIASANGIKGAFKMTKKLLIKNLEEKDGIS